MTISQELFSAILSMDAYNRGYNAGLNDNGENDLDGLGESGQIGNATILTRIDSGISDNQYQVWKDAGFYAIAYDWNGETIISYRGTDGEFLGNLSEIIFTDLPIVSGDFNEPQLHLAAKFYQAVAGTAIDPITLTGHSLGGALAGFTAASGSVGLVA